MFSNRQDAGNQLVQPLIQYKNKPQTLVLGLARGGVVVASALAKGLSLPLNVVILRKIGAPGNPELAIGAITEDGKGVFNTQIIKMLGVSESYIKKEIEKEKAVAQKRIALYRQYAPLPELKDSIVILVDDGIATGATMLAAIKAMKESQVKKVVVAVPVSAVDSLEHITKVADEVVCLHSQEDFFGVGFYYKDFIQVEDEEIVYLLKGINQEVDHE